MNNTESWEKKFKNKVSLYHRYLIVKKFLKKYIDTINLFLQFITAKIQRYNNKMSII